MIDISQKIIECQNEIITLKNKIRSYAIKKAETIAEYEKKIAVITIQLKNGKELELEGEIIINPLATIIDKIARGICWKDKLAYEQAEAEYKGIIISIQAIESVLNGYQSINRYLKEM